MPDIDLKETQEELQWLEKKLSIKVGSKATRLANGQKISTSRGEVYWCEFGYNLGSELRDCHPCVIVQNNTTAQNLRTVLVAPITHASTRANKPASLVPVAQQKDSAGKVLIEGYADIANMRTISKARLGRRITALTTADMQSIDSAIATVTDLYHHYKDVSDKLTRAQAHADLRSEKVKKIRAILQEIENMPEEEVPSAVRAKIADALNV